MTEPTGGPLRRILTDTELATLYAAIDAAGDTAALVTAVITGVYTILLDGTGQAWNSHGPADPVDPTAHAIPATQWHAIAEAATRRAEAWGSAAHIGLDLANLMPSTYDDPDLPAPLRSRTDHRPDHYDLRLHRTAIEVIAACETHLAALSEHYGADSRIAQDAERSWHHALAGLLGPGAGTPRHISGDGPLSLYISSPAFDYGIVFHGARRHCLTDGCYAVLTDDGSASPSFPEGPMLEHRHAPSYPIGAPQPGTWSMHS
jgi:hypothetical protein